MAERTAMLMRASALLGTLMESSAYCKRGIRLGIASTAAATTGANLAHAEANEEDDAATAMDEKSQPPEAENTVENGGSVVRSLGEQMSFGGVLGFAAGYSIRKVGKALLFLVGTEVVILQYMAYRQWLTMDWKRVGRDLAPKFSKSTWDGLVQILVYKMPFSVAFSGGLVAGLRLSAAK